MKTTTFYNVIGRGGLWCFFVITDGTYKKKGKKILLKNIILVSIYMNDYPIFIIKKNKLLFIYNGKYN